MCLVMKHVSDQGNQKYNGPHQDQIFDKPSALFSSVGQKSDSARVKGVGLVCVSGGEVVGVLMHPVGSL